jgi:putative ABC transport system ATP-binding protein
VKTLIKLEDIHYQYPKAQTNALTNINLSIESGDYLAITGTSGSGKSTLLSILGLITKPTKGEYALLNTATSQLTKNSIALLKNREIGFIFQNFNLLNHLNVFDNVALPLSYNSDIPRKKYSELVGQALLLVGMEEFEARFPDQLSGGQQQRVAIARALVNSPSLILADEPTGNLDSKTSEQIFAVLDELHNKGKTICLITHDTNYAMRAKRRVNMIDGFLKVEASC